MSRWLIVLALFGPLGCSTASANPPPAIAKNDDGTQELANKLDVLLMVHQKQAGLSAAPVVDDARFLRRVTLDLTGTLPDPATVRAFLADLRPDKRARAIDALLSSPAYATHWASVWDDVLMGATVRNGQIDHRAFHRWLEHAFAQNQPWNQQVFDLVSATGVNSLGGESSLPKNAPPQDIDQREARAGVNGAVNWLIKYRDAPTDLAGSTSRIFLGVQIQCAQCHDHKTEAWKQTDFRRLTAAFARTKPVQLDVKGEMVGVRRIDLRDEDHVVGAGKKATVEWQMIVKEPPTALDGTLLDSPRPRRALAGWVVSEKNPWFAKATVNRYWAQLLGRGFVDPVDDFRPSNPPMAPDVLDALSADFVSHGYDLKRLLRTICLTQAYQRTALAPEKAVAEDFWARGRLRPLTAEQLLNAVMDATQIEPVLEEQAEKKGKSLQEVKLQLQREVTFLFDVDEESDDDEFTGTVQQALMLINGGLVNRSVRSAPGDTLEQVMALPTDGARVDSLYLRTLSRPPSEDERIEWLRFINSEAASAEIWNQKGKHKASKPKREAYEDLFWALLNSSEFHFNH